MTKKIISSFFIVLIITSLIIIIPIQLILIQFAALTNINKSLPFTYMPSSPSSVEKLSINADKANIDIRYVDPDMDYHGLIVVNLIMIGSNLDGKSYEDFFEFQWDISNSQANFTVKIISDEWYNPLLWIKKELNIVVYLRKDIVFDIFIEVNQGDVDLSVPYMVSVNNLEINAANGEILFDLNHCTLKGNISCYSNIGDLNFFMKNIQGSNNIIWNLTSEDGGLNIELYQDIEIGTNITGSIVIEALNLIYVDKSSNIGAMFTFPSSEWNPQGKIVTGFNDPVFPGNGFYLGSSDFPARSNFNLHFYTIGYYDLELRNNYI